MTPDESSLIAALGMILAALVTYLAGFAMINATRRRSGSESTREGSESSRRPDKRRGKKVGPFAGAQPAWEHTPY